MDISKFTQKSVQAIQDMEKLAYEYGNQEIDQEHFFYALIRQDDSLIAKLLEKMGISEETMQKEAKAMLAAKVKVSGAGQVYISKDLNRVLISAEDEAKKICPSTSIVLRRSVFR